MVVLALGSPPGATLFRRPRHGGDLSSLQVARLRRQSAARLALCALKHPNYRTAPARASRRRVSHRTNALRASSIHSTMLAAAMIDSNCIGGIG